MSNLNVNSTATASSATSAINKPANDQQKSSNGFQSTLENEIQAGNTAQAFSDLKIKMEDDKVIELKNCRRVHIEPTPVRLESEQKRLGVSKAAVEKMMADWDKRNSERLIGLKKAAEVMTPEGMKKYLISKEVKAVARDAEGNIVAKLYKDGSFYCTNQLAGIVSEFMDGHSAEKAMQKIAKQPNVIVTHYQIKVTDFDLMSEVEKQRVLSPEFYSEERQSILNQIAELEWSIAYGVGNGLSPLFGPHAADAAIISQDAKTSMQLKGYSAPDMLTAEPSLEKNYSLDLDGHFHLTGAAVPSLDTNYIMKLLRESHISNTAAAEISQKSLSVALTYISQHPINNEA